MSQMIFVNLPVKNLSAATDFYTAIGFNLNPEFSDENASCMVLSENIYVMLLAEPRFRDFIVGEIADANRTTEVINALTLESNEAVDRVADAALGAGGSEWLPAMESPMYLRSFRDPDGHVWEVTHMSM